MYTSIMTAFKSFVETPLNENNGKKTSCFEEKP